ncbi:thiamine phosphate synthase [Alkalilimnicola sp. S0819]|uniref:thiamine phosphate synthase n=1 Tax=Alkalilimnicola sp. S0819 TaxID=2613922 RepID=UPI0012615F77|nr:thiamine phosphate synthase [Alkalilimnicola sp. S0819]KAB7623017.1 thiamine phosphate synthase [Alkalilimnicola sp. S0819]MPQ17129.1 thiamine phosphate synthase [Alkalilimnicola sp. S0819]
MSTNPIRGLYAITDADCQPPERLLEAVAEVLDAGARVLQYRDKSGNSALREEQAAGLRALSRGRALFLVNDDVELAARVGADGVHLGEQDAALSAARKRLGPNAVIGISCYNDLQRARDAQAAGADYAAFGAFFPSGTKPLARRAEPALLRAARAELRLPLVAIGGITPENAPALLEAGADAVAVIRGIFAQAHPGAAAAAYVRCFSGRF